MKKEKLQKTSIYLLSLAVFIVVNFLVSYLSLRGDFSPGKAHTLSLSTKKIINQLEDVVNIKVFISSDLPLRLLPLKTDVVDLVNEYKKQGKGKIIVKFLDPKKNQKAQNEAQELGMPELQFSQVEKDKYAVSASYFGLAVLYRDKKEIIPQAINLATLEYDITSSIYKMTRKKPLKIGLLGTKQSYNQQEDDLYTTKKTLQQQFELDLAEKIDPSLKTILVFDDNNRQYATSEGEMIKDYLDKGGKAIFFVDGVYVTDRLMTKPAGHNLFFILDAYGLKLNQNLLLSYSSELASFTTGRVSFFTPYPFWLKTSNFSPQSSELSNIGSLVFPWASSIDIVKKKGVKTRVLVKTEKQSWEQKDNFVLAPNNIPPPDKQQLKQFNLIVEAKLKNGGQLAIIPSSRFVKERFLTRGQENLAFLVNLINDYASEGALSGIRSRAVFIAPIKQLPENTKDIVKYANLLLLPGLLGFIGTIRLLKRR